MTFSEACILLRGRLLVGKYAHSCPEWDELPIDETCREWDCGCDIIMDDQTVSKFLDRKNIQHGE